MSDREFYGIEIPDDMVEKMKLGTKVKLVIEGSVESLHAREKPNKSDSSGESPDEPMLDGYSKDTMSVKASSVKITPLGNEFVALAETE